MSPQLRQRSKSVYDVEECRATIALQIPPGISQTPKTYTKSCRLLQLPPELLMQIVTHADLVDRVILALSCKSLLSIAIAVHAVHCKLHVPNPRLHKALGLACKCKSMEDLLRRLWPKDPHGRPSRSWNLCVDCMKYLPTRKGYWTTAAQRPRDSDDWGREEKKMWKSSVEWFGNGAKLQCPPCRVREDALEDLTEETPSAAANGER